MRSVILLLAAVALAGCARTSVMPLAADTVQITTKAARFCGSQGAQELALKIAAIETIDRGYDRFFITGSSYQNNVRVVGRTPLISNSTSTSTGNFRAYRYGNMTSGTIQSYGSGTTITSGGQPIIRGTHDQLLVVKMLHEDDEDAGNAVDARGVLGEDWQKIVESGTPNTCM